MGSTRALEQSSRTVAVGDLVTLIKPRITALVVMTEACGFVLAPAHAESSTAVFALVGTLFVVASANALNMWWERDVDAKMARTRDRPLAAGRLSPSLAVALALALAGAGLALLVAVNALTAALGAFALVTYVCVYTPLKRHTWRALLVGSIAGALPPLMGWTAATGTVGAGGLFLFAVLFFWQVPHFAAIAIYRAREYAGAGLAVISVELGERGARRVMFRYTLLLVAASLALHTPARIAGTAYALVAAALGAAFLLLVMRRPSKRPAAAWARRVFGYSIIYLVVLLVALLVDHGSS